MFADIFKLQSINALTDYDYSDSETNVTVELKIKEYNSLVELLEDPNIINSSYNEMAAVADVLLSNKLFVKALAQKGFRNVEAIKKIDDKLVATKEFFISTENPSGWGTSRLEEVDLENADGHVGQKLASDKVNLYQKIDKSCIGAISKKAGNAYAKAIEVAAAKKEKSEETQAKRAATLKAKRLAEAQKVIEELSK